MSSSRQYRADYSAKSLRSVVRPSAVFAVRLPAELVDDLHEICSKYHVNRNALITLFLGNGVVNHAAILGEVLEGNL
jgi:hypothetical protein